MGLNFNEKLQNRIFAFFILVSNYTVACDIRDYSVVCMFRALPKSSIFILKQSPLKKIRENFVPQKFRTIRCVL